ncbi:MAG TPA: ABC transporter permease, partial [Blastocatellia bacterium]|nr:ABC transporter permease [Blastocatellia bacterium]
MITTLLQDIRFSLRILRRNAGFSVVAILSLGLGIGAATGIFSLVSAVLLSELPYQQPDSLVTVWQRPPGGGTNVVSGPAFLRWRESNDVFEEMAAVGYQSYNLAGEGEPENVTGGAVSAGFFEMLGVRPVLGRTITSGEDRPGAPHVAVIGYPLWQRRWGGDPGVIGKSINLNGDSYTVVGVMPRGFQFMVNQVELWVPLALDPVKANPRFHYLLVSARMKQGVTTERAQAAMDSLAARIGEELPETDWGAAIVPLRKAIVGSSNTTLLVLLG